MASDPDSNRRDDTRLGADGRYRIRRELGHGMMGVVWEADDTLLGRTVAIKTIELAFGVAPEAREQFERRFFTEARAAAKLSHPGIVVCHDVGKDPASGKLFIVLEHLKGRTLAERVAGERIPWREGLSIVVGVARAVHHAHQQGVVHRDLKPANVMLLEDGAATEAGAAVKIMDFGVAHVDSPGPGLTAEGDRFGSPAYMSPEMTLGLASDARSDIFSIGSILCTALLGREWFAAPSIAGTLQRVVHEDAPALSALVPGVPPALDTVVARAMAKRPGDRHASAAELADDLEDVLAGRPPRHSEETALSELVALVDRPPATAGDAHEPLAALLVESPASEPAAATSPRTTHRLRRAAVFAVVALPLAGALYLLRRPPAPPPRSAATSPAPARTLLPQPTTAARASATPSPAPSPEATAAPLPAARPAAAPARPQRTTSREAATPPPLTEVTPAVAGAQPEAVPGVPPGQARLRLDVEHPLENGHLTVWVDGALAFETRLQAQSAKKIVALTLRSGHLEQLLEVSPGRHEVRVEVRWEAERRVASTVADVAAGSTGLLEVRLGRMSRELRLEWSRLAAP